jgi:hypothetical protein
MAVTIDAIGVALTTGSVTSASYTGITVGLGPSRGLVIFLSTNTAITSVSVTWDNGGTNQAMTQVVTASNAGAENVWVFVLRSPTSGNKTALVSWTTAAVVSIEAISFTQVLQTTVLTAFPNGNNNSGTSASATLAITSAAGNMPVMIANTANSVTLSAPTQSPIYTSNATVIAGAQFANGVATTNFAWTLSGSVGWVTAGVDVAAAPPPTQIFSIINVG